MNYYFNGLKKITDYSGRASRKEYWMFILQGMFAISLVAFLTLIAVMQLFQSELQTVVFMVYIIHIIHGMLFGIAGIAIGVRILHDVGYSGWWTLFALVPVIGMALFIPLVMKGVDGANKYGTNPSRQLQ